MGEPRADVPGKTPECYVTRVTARERNPRLPASMGDRLLVCVGSGRFSLSFHGGMARESAKGERKKEKKKNLAPARVKMSPRAAGGLLRSCQLSELEWTKSDSAIRARSFERARTDSRVAERYTG